MADNPLLGYADVNVAQSERLPPSGAGELLSNAATSVVGAVADSQTKSLQANLQGESDAFVAEAIARQDQMDSPLTDDAIAKAIGADVEDLNSDQGKIVKPVLEQIAKLKLAEEQGVIDVSELKIRQENILRQAVARHPAFTDQFIQGASTQLGYNPIGAQIDALTAEGRASKGSPDDPRSYLEKQYDALGETMGLNPTLKVRDPVSWYSKIHNEAQAREAISNKKREVDLLVATREFGTEKATAALGSWWTANSRKYISAALGAAAQVAASTTGKAGADAISSGSLQKQKEAIAAAKAKMITDAQTAMGPYAQWMGPDKIQGAVAPVAAMFDAALASAEPAKVLEGMKMIVDSGVYRDVYLKYPGIAAFEPIARILGNLPKDSPFSASISQDLGRKYSAGIAAMLGGVINDSSQLWTTDGFPTSPATNLNFDSNNEDDYAKVTTKVISGITDALVNSSKSPDIKVRVAARIGALNMVGSYAQDYKNYMTKHAMGQVPPRSVVDPWINLMASNEYRDTVGDPSIPEGVKLGLKGVTSEILDQEWLLRTRDISDRTKMTVPALSAAHTRTNIDLAAALRFGWENGKVTAEFASDEDLALAGIESVPPKAKEAAMRHFAKSGALDDLARVVRAKAHQDGVSYEAALLTLAQDSAKFRQAGL